MKISAISGKFVFDDDEETPNTITCSYEFEADGKKNANTIGNVFYGSKGYLAIDGNSKYQTWMGKEQEPGPKNRKGGDHFGNFIGAVRSRKQSELNAEVEEGAISTALVIGASEHLRRLRIALARVRPLVEVQGAAVPVRNVCQVSGRRSWFRAACSGRQPICTDRRAPQCQRSSCLRGE
jgi:hypothetical protein